MSGRQQLARLGAVADALGGQGPRHQVGRLRASRAEIAAPQGPARVDHLPGPGQPQPDGPGK